MLFHFVERKWWYFLFSALLIVPGVFFLAIGGLRPGIEFKGGTLLEISFATRPEDTAVQSFFSAHGPAEATGQGGAGGGGWGSPQSTLPAQRPRARQEPRRPLSPRPRYTQS